MGGSPVNGFNQFTRAVAHHMTLWNLILLQSHFFYICSLYLFFDTRGIRKMPVEHQQIKLFFENGCPKTFAGGIGLQLFSRFIGPQTDQFNLTRIIFQQSYSHSVGPLERYIIN